MNEGAVDIPASSRHLEPELFDYVRELCRRDAAMALGEDKEYLVVARLGDLWRRRGFASLGAMLDALRRGAAPTSLRAQVVDALTINETSFFRDHHPFEALRAEVLPELLRQARGRRLRIWCAASSTGQEPYSVAMLLLEHFADLCPDGVTIDATDLSQRALHYALRGAYTQSEVNRGLPARYLVKYFRQAAGRWWLSEEVRSLVEFRAMNLMEPWGRHDPYDLVLLRNVLIYFDEPDKATVLRRVREALVPGGVLVLGSSEAARASDPVGERVWERRGDSRTFSYRSLGAAR